MKFNSSQKSLAVAEKTASNFGGYFFATPGISVVYLQDNGGMFHGALLSVIMYTVHFFYIILLVSSTDTIQSASGYKPRLETVHKGK